MFNVHNALGWFGAAVVLLMVLTGTTPMTKPQNSAPESVRANPASYRPVYVPTYRGGSGGGSGGGWSGGK